MAQINLTAEILSHSDEEIIEYLAGEMTEVKRIYARATKEGNPNLLYIAAANLDDIYNVLNALDRRNKENKLQ